MVPFLTAVGLVLASFGLQVFVWRVRRPRHQARALAMIFAGVPVLAGVALVVCGGIRAWALLPRADWGGILLFHGGATVSYLLIYMGIEETSPSLAIVRALAAVFPLGRTREDLAACITEDQFARPRLRGLQRGGFLIEAAAGSHLTARGRRTARLATLLAALFGVHDSA